MTRVLTVREAADQIGRSRGFILALVADDLVAGHKIRGRWYVNEASLTAWLDAGAEAPGARIVSMPGVVHPRGYRGAA